MCAMYFWVSKDFVWSPTGTFYAWDQLSVLFEFVRESLLDGWQPFELIAPGGQKLQESEKVSLVESNLVSLWQEAVQKMFK